MVEDVQIKEMRDIIARQGRREAQLDGTPGLARKVF